MSVERRLEVAGFGLVALGIVLAVFNFVMGSGLQLLASIGLSVVGAAFRWAFP